MRGLDFLAAREHAHGTRARYVGRKCRCEPCTAANREYSRQRRKESAAGDTRRLVPAERARARLLALAKRGVGLRAVSEATDVPRSSLLGLRRGKRHWLREDAEHRILSVDVSAASDGAHMSARGTQKLIREMLRAELVAGGGS